MTEEIALHCTFDKNHPEIKTQHLYICKTCHFSEFETICEDCAEFCHAGHEKIDLGYCKGYCRCGQGTSACYCFCQNPVEGMFDERLSSGRQCDFLINKNHFHSQGISCCTDCSMVNGSCACVPCGVICHCHHSTSFSHSSSAYCDCGDPGQPRFHEKCKISEPVNNDPIPICSSLLFKNEVKQEKWFCNTCDPQHMFPICSGCINVCHKDHNVEKNEESEFICSCGTRKLNCKCFILSKIEPAA